MVEALDEHFGYLSDQIKCERYAAAIKQVVQPEHTVLDLGCGSGLLGLISLRAGANKVYFVDEGPVIELARRAVENAGLLDQAEFFQATSYELALPEPVDVVVCDHVGYFGFDYGVLALLADARRRFLKPGGILIPGSIEILAVPIESEPCRELVARWRSEDIPAEFAWAITPAANSKHGVTLSPENALAQPASLATLELGSQVDEFLTWKAEFTMTRDGVLDGIAGCFDCRLYGDVHMTNSPLADDRLDRPQAFLPLEEPVTIRAGEKVLVTIMARHEDSIIGWVVEIPEYGKRFIQTTFNGLLLDESAIDQSRPDRVARLNDRGHARQIILSYCDGQRTIGDVVALIQDEHADLFPSPKALRNFVRGVLARDTGE